MPNQPSEEVYRLAEKDLWDWTSSRTDMDDLWEKVDESSRVVVDAVWHHLIDGILE